MGDKPLAYVDADGVVCISGSAAGKCSRAIWASLQEITPVAPAERLESILTEGHLHEAAVKELLESEGAVISSQDEVELWVIPGKLKYVGHVDGIIENWGQGWENKAFGKEGFRRWRSIGFDAYPEYPWQVSVYMEATKLPFLYTVKCRDDGQLDRMVLTEPPIPLVQLQAKAVGVYVAYNQHEMPACDPERWMCSFFFLHDEAAEGETFELDDPFYEATAGRLAEVREQIKYLNGLEEGLKGDLNKLSPGIHIAGEYQIEVTEVKATKFDKDAAKAEDPDLIARHTKPNEYVTVKVKGKKL